MRTAHILRISVTHWYQTWCTWHPCPIINTEYQFSHSLSKQEPKQTHSQNKASFSPPSLLKSKDFLGPCAEKPWRGLKWVRCTTLTAPSSISAWDRLAGTTTREGTEGGDGCESITETTFSTNSRMEVSAFKNLSRMLRVHGAALAVTGQHHCCGTRGQGAQTVFRLENLNN